MGLEAPSPAWPARDLPVGRGRGGAEPSKRPRAARRRFDPPRPQRPPAGPDAGEYVLAGGRKGGDLAGSRTTTGAWRWPGWSPRAMAGQAAIDVFDKGAAARGAHPAPARPTTARPRAPAGAQSPPRPAGARALPGRRTPRRQTLQAHHPRATTSASARPCSATRAGSPWPTPSPSPRETGRPLRPHPATPSAPTRACPGASPGSRPRTPARWPGRPDRATAPTPSPPAANPRATRPPGADRRTGAGPSPPAASAKPAITRNGRRPHRRHRVPGPPRPGRAPNHRDLGRHHHHLRRRPRRGPDPVQPAARRRHLRLPPPARPHQPTRQAPAAGGPNRHRSPDTPNVTHVLTQNRHPCPETSQFQPSFSKAKCTSRVQNANLDREGTRAGRRVIASGRRGQAGTGRARGRRPAEDCGVGTGPLTRWCAARSGPPGRGGCSPRAAGRAWPGYWRRAWRRRRRTGPGARRSARSTGPRP